MRVRDRAPLLFSLPLPWILALRYLRSTRRDAFTSFLSLVASGGMALGVAALLLVLAMLSGFQRALLAQVLARTPEIEVTLPAGSEPARTLAAVAAVAGVERVSRVLRGRGWLVAGDRVQPVEMVGIEGAVPPTFPGAAGAPAGVYVGDSLAARWGLEPGERVTLASPRPTLTPFGPQPRTRTLPLAGAFESAPTEDRERLALPIEVAEGLFGRPGLVLEVSAGGLEASLAVAPRLAAALPPGAEVRTWRDLNRPLLFALELEKLLTFVAVSLVVGVASLALVADLALVIASKQAEIGMLQACGAPAGSIRRAFLCLGALLAALGTSVGAGLGVGSAWVLDTYRLLGVPGQVYFIDHLPFLVRGGDVAAVVGLTLALALGAASYAARRATLLTPVEALAR